ncbi:rab-like protein 2A isoform X2 [Octopus sinensis]|uniref:Rab-like protein 2A isoform X2 n=1 Tax=Octopus sinensis TaxID=2607531 RepID=A0A7E6FHR8_9MOLL|nr:rab-like protein 2A isoform X2 [Octopus sinensis]
MANVEDVESKSGSGENDEKQLGEEIKVKIICIGDSAVGKSKLMERFLIDGYKPQQSSTYALTTFNHKMKVNGQKVSVDFWDTAGQERFSTLHRSYYHQAHACIMVFDATRKITYKNLSKWLNELQEHRPNIPCLCAANKIDVKLFTDAIEAAVGYKLNTTDFLDKVMRELESFDVEDEGNLSLTDEQKKI